MPSGFSLVVSYSEAMKVFAGTDDYVYPGRERHASFHQRYVDADGKQYTANYSVTDAGVTVPAVGVSITGAEDLAGNLQVSFSQSNVFSINTQNATVLSVTPNLTMLSDATVGSGKFTVAVVYSEAMKATPAPTITFTPDVSSTLTFASGSWSGNTYTATYNVADANVAVSNVGIGVTGAEDAAAGNLQVPFSQSNAFSIDTQNPTVTIDQATAQATRRSSPINFTVVFSEPVSDFTTGDVTLTGTRPGRWWLR